MEGITIALISAVSASIIAPVVNAIIGRVKRKSEQEHVDMESLRNEVSMLHTASCLMLVDKICYLSKCSIEEGSITARRKDFIHRMADTAHAMGANGEVSIWVQAIDELPMAG